MRVLLLGTVLAALTGRGLAQSDNATANAIAYEQILYYSAYLISADANDNVVSPDCSARWESQSLCTYEQYIGYLQQVGQALTINSIGWYAANPEETAKELVESGLCKNEVNTKAVLETIANSEDVPSLIVAVSKYLYEHSGVTEGVKETLRGIEFMRGFINNQNVLKLLQKAYPAMDMKFVLKTLFSGSNAFNFFDKGATSAAYPGAAAGMNQAIRAAPGDSLQLNAVKGASVGRCTVGGCS